MPAAPDRFSYLAYIRNCLRRKGRTREDAEDLVQEAFLRLELYCRKGREVLQPEAFLMRTAMNLSVSGYRRDQVSPIERHGADVSTLLPLADPPDEVFAAEERLKAIQRILETVGHRARDAFLLHRLGGFSYAEIAQRLSVSISTIEKDIASAAAALALERQRNER